MSRHIARFFSRASIALGGEDGQALAEYGLLLALVVVAAVLAVGALGLAIAGIFGNVSVAMP